MSIIFRLNNVFFLLKDTSICCLLVFRVKLVEEQETKNLRPVTKKFACY